MSIAYDSDTIPGFGSFVHYGGDGIGMLGSQILNETADGNYGGGFVQQCLRNSGGVDPAVEYRLCVISGYAGFKVNENGSGTATGAGTATLTLYADGVEVP